MFWYSENSHPKLFNEGSTTFDYGNFRDIHVKEHLVWTCEFAQFIQSFTKEKVTPIGSILFYQNTSPKNVAKELDVLIFDVAPYRSASKSEFYSVDNCVNYIELLSATLKNKFGNSIKVGLKQKRKITSAHSEKYINLIQMQDWISQDPNANLYELISRSKCVIGIPYTSAVLVALELNIPCYYFFNSTTIELPEYFNGIQVLKSTEELIHVLNASVSKGRGYE
jgi:polysaccharide biosynthesis PFTS motif protein